MDTIDPNDIYAVADIEDNSYLLFSLIFELNKFLNPPATPKSNIVIQFKTDRRVDQIPYCSIPKYDNKKGV